MERGLPGCGTDTQADRLLRALRTGPVTTHEARQYLDLPCPASRVLALRQRGYEFEKRWIVQAGPAGWFHKYVEYRLTGSGGA
ncbi:MAG: hypothetical protein KGM91_23220 [Burkholderiales bacterium]|nr:hypothetical protein [Burkholderiales bacterium]